MINLTEDELKEIFFEDKTDKYTVVFTSDWVSDGKYESCDLVFKDTNDVHYITYISRTGSYYTDYEFEFYNTKCKEAELVEVTSKVWQEK